MTTVTRLRQSIVGSAAPGAAVALLAGLAGATQDPAPDPSGATGRVTLSIVGTTDLHGRVFPDDGQGGLALLGGYLRNLRAARAADGGAVLLLDAGDSFEGGIASNLSEGALVVDAYNALGYDALAIGNHEFDYGANDTASANDNGTPDMRGALRAAAARARFPFLAANVIDTATGRPLAWPNVRPSTLVDVAGLRVGIVGVMTRGGLTMTLAANVQGLDTTPLAPAVENEARRLRERGADLVLILAHAGGACFRFDNPTDLSSCDDDAEIFELARRLPAGLVDAIVAGHTHRAVAHEVAGLPIVQAYSRGSAFARVDLTVRRGAGVVAARLFPPQAVCAAVAADGWSCATGGDGTPATYEAAPVRPEASIVAAMQPELERVNRWRAEPLGVTLTTPVPRNRDGAESPLGNLFADAFLAALPNADLAIGMGVRRGGLRRGLPAGTLTRGPLYDVFPFDNRIVEVAMTGAQVQRALARELTRELAGSRGGIPSVSGVRVRVTCAGARRQLEIVRPSGATVGLDETLVVAATDFFAARAGRDSLVARSEAPPATAPLVREAVARWLTARGGRLGAADLATPPRWELPERAACLAADATRAP